MSPFPFRPFSVPVPKDVPVTTVTLKGRDEPSMNVPLTSQQWADANLPGADLLTQVNILLTFETYVVAQTTDTRNSAGQVYTALAEGDWSFCGSGTIDPETLAWVPGEAVTTPASWEPTGGTQPLYVSGTLALDAARSEQFQ